MLIIVGYDPQTCDLAPVDFGVAASRFTGAPLMIASVHGVGDDRLGERQMREDLLADAAETLEELKGELHAQGIAAEYRSLAGTSAPRALHELADSQDAGLLVIGSTRQGTIGRLLPGSTAQRLMHGAPCPIAVIPHGWRAGEGLRTIGVAYVDTEEGRQALRGAHALARQAGAALRVLTVAGVGFGAHAETEARTAVRRGKGFDEVEGEHRVLAETAARNAVAELAGDVAVQVDAFAEDPAQTLIAVSEEPGPSRVRLTRVRACPRGPARRRVAPGSRGGSLPPDRAAARRSSIARGARVANGPSRTLRPHRGRRAGEAGRAAASGRSVRKATIAATTPSYSGTRPSWQAHATPALADAMDAARD